MRRAVYAGIEDGDGEPLLHVYCTHLLHTHQRLSDTQLVQAHRLLRISRGRRTVVMGDFNAVPGSEVIAAMNNHMRDTDPDSNPTWSAHPEGCSGCNPGGINTRLDYIFVSRDIYDGVVPGSFQVMAPSGSDHLAISVEIDL